MEIWRLHCRACGHRERCGLDGLLDRLRSLGMLRREAKPAEEVVLALAVEKLAKLTCTNCGAAELQRSEAGEFDDDGFDDEAGDWPAARCCELCGAVIPAERLAIFPSASRCVTCEDEPASEDREFCPRCGAVMQLRLRRARSQYELHCRECGATA